jgi:hypothetical protein
VAVLPLEEQVVGLLKTIQQQLQLAVLAFKVEQVLLLEIMALHPLAVAAAAAGKMLPLMGDLEDLVLQSFVI